MRGLGQNPTEQDLKEMIDDVDLDADGLVKFDVRACCNNSGQRQSPCAPPPDRPRPAQSQPSQPASTTATILALP